MHDYSIDKHPKEKILFSLAFIAITVSPWANSAIHSLGVEFGIKSLSATAISVSTVFFGIFWIFDNYLWRLKALRRIFLVPDISGTWECNGVTVIKSGGATHHVWSGEMTIVQSWSKILIHLQTKESFSDSYSASVHSIKGIGYQLVYQYDNDPKASSDDLKKHNGAAELQFDEKCESAEGNYYTDQHRSTVGQLKLRRKS